MGCFTCYSNAARSTDFEVVLEDEDEKQKRIISRQLSYNLPLRRDLKMVADVDDDEDSDEQPTDCPRLPSLLRSRLQNHVEPKKSHLGHSRLPWRARSHMWEQEPRDPSEEGMDSEPSSSYSITSSAADDLSAAMRNFRMLEASQMLQQLEADGDDVSRTLSSAEVERIRRVSSRCQEHIHRRQAQWPIHGHNLNLNMKWGFRLEHGLVSATFSTEIDAGVGIVRAVAALCEMHLYKGFNDDFVTGSALEETQAANDCMWRVVTHNKVLSIRNDNIWQVTVTDALEEEGLIIIDQCIPEEDVQSASGVPPPAEGCSRITYAHTTYALQPIRGRGNGSLTAYKLMNHAVTQPLPRNYSLLSVMPSFAQRRILGNGMEGIVGRLKEHIRTSQDLSWAMQNSPRASLYEALETHLEQWV